jgi:Asp-tRNA(Asn)/Glu-tRNA(Gln) amidotransferase A subunit family amidase
MRRSSLGAAGSAADYSLADGAAASASGALTPAAWRAALVQRYESELKFAACFADGHEPSAAEVHSREGPLAGVPVLVSLDADVPGRPTTLGVPALRECLASRAGGAGVVATLLSAGATLLGSPCLPPLALDPSAVSARGPPKNVRRAMTEPRCNCR